MLFEQQNWTYLLKYVGQTVQMFKRSNAQYSHILLIYKENKFILLSIMSTHYYFSVPPLMLSFFFQCVADPRSYFMLLSRQIVINKYISFTGGHLVLFI